MYSNVEAELARRKATRADVARIWNVTPQTACLKLNGKSDISFKEAIALKDFLKIDMPIERLFSESGKEETQNG